MLSAIESALFMFKNDCITGYVVIDEFPTRVRNPRKRAFILSPSSYLSTPTLGQDMTQGQV